MQSGSGNVHINIRVFGSVQGVAYRASAVQKAESFGLAGWIRNEKDGTVCAEVEGPERAVQEFVGWCKDGSPHARVTCVKATGGEIRGYRAFKVRY